MPRAERSGSDKGGPSSSSSSSSSDSSSHTVAERYTNVVGRFVHGVELAAATVFAVLFAIGVIDLTLQIGGAIRSGRITDPLVVIGFIDTGLLLLIIVEVYQTVLAYVEENDTRRIVQLVTYTGIIAMVRKAIIYRTSEYPTVQDALFAAGSYAIIILALVTLLYVERMHGTGSSMQLDQ